MILAKPAFATCPVCIVAVGSGLWLAERLGVDDLIAAIWIGAFSASLAIALAGKFKKFKLPYPEISWTIVFYLLTLATLKIQGKLGNPYCKIWGVCKIWLGVTLGNLVVWLGVVLDKLARKINQGKVFFPFQKVVLPLAATLLVSFIFHLILC